MNITRSTTSGMINRWLEQATSNRLVVNDRDGSLLVYVPPGEFEMGDGEGTDCTKHRVWLDGYYIGVFAVTNAQYQRFVRATGHRAPNNNRWQDKSFSDHPVTDVSWEDASAYVQWSGLRLPSEAEWEKSARGPGNWKYPWGDAWDAQRCRHSGNCGSETTCPVYGYGTGVSGYGCYNTSGNVWEWCADWYESGYYGASPSRNPRGPEGGSFRVFRGGCWDYDASRCRAAYRGRYEPGRRYDGLGFRPAR